MQFREPEDLSQDFVIGAIFTVTGIICLCTPHPAIMSAGGTLFGIGVSMMVPELKLMERENRELQERDPATIPDPFKDGRFSNN